jgi:transposase-like protein
MPWEQSLPMDQKTQFVAEYLRDSLSFTELCDRYGISRKTGYKWSDRYQAEGPAGLADRSRRPHSSPDQTPEPLRLAIIEARRRHPTWGPRNCSNILEAKTPKLTGLHAGPSARFFTAPGLFANGLVGVSPGIQESRSLSPRPPTISGASISKGNSKLVTVVTVIR